MMDIERGKISQSKHQFGSIGKPLRSICSVCMAFTCLNINGEEVAKLKKRFDVIYGNITFIIGMPSFRAMGETLNCCRESLTVAINELLHCLGLTEYQNHLRLPLSSSSSFQRRLDERRKTPQGTFSETTFLYSHHQSPSYHPDNTAKKSLFDR